MIELIIKEYLSDKIDESVFFEIPNNAPESFIVIEKTGSSKRNHIRTSTFAFQSYGKSLYDSAMLNEKVKNAMDNIVNETEICRSSLNSDYNFTDTTFKRYRYQAVYDITHY